MLDDVERRRLLVEPSGEDAAELPLRVAHVELDERAGELLNLPGRAGLAGAQPHDHVADAERLAGAHLKLARDAIALVEKADHGDALRHRGGAGREPGDGLRNIDRLRLGLGLCALLVLPLGHLAPATGGKRERRRQAQS